MEEIVSLPPMEFFNNDYHLVLDFIESLGNPKYKIAGNVNLQNSDIESLGNLVEVGGHLDLFGSNIQILPENLKINGYLDIRLTDIDKLPNNLETLSALEIAYSNIKTIPNNLKVLGSYFDVRYTPLSNDYSHREIYKMIIDKGGYVNSILYRD